MRRACVVALALTLAPAGALAQEESPWQDGTVADAPQDGTADGTAPADGTVPADGTLPADGVAGGTAAGLPSFLDTTDRRLQDERPPPTPAQVQALREMEAEVERFTKIGGSYRDTVVSIVRREYLRQRRERDQWYGRQILEEERLQNEARERAIRLFERFIRRYPDDPTYTPDAMFRLGELYFERSAVLFQEEYDAAQAARDRGEDVLPPETADFTATIELYQRLVRQFPDYRRIDGVYYLIGYCLGEMGRMEEARMAWLNLVCANHFTYDPDAALGPLPEGDPDPPEGDPDHPATDLDGPEGDEALDLGPPPFTDPYQGCQPVRPEVRFESETWFRIGEYHFDDYNDPHALDMAISAYNRILSDREDRNYNLALYKVAWAYYRASRYPEAVRHFGMLVEWSDEEQRRTGRAGSELRPEAVQYLGISFAYDDWNENQIPDPEEGMPTGIQRVQDQSLLPQDLPPGRNWAPDVYFQLGQVYFDEAKYPQAIAVWRLALQRWPMHHRAPEITNMIARAHQAHNEQEQYFAALAELGQFGPGSDWYDSNNLHPAEQRNAEQLAEGALIRTALRQHQAAQVLRRRCVSAQDLSLCEEAQRNYASAADAYRTYLERYPNDPQAYELRYNLADALYWSERYEEAAVEYAAVRDSNLDDSHLSEAARRVVEAMKRVVEAEVAAGRLQIRDEPPPTEGTPPRVRSETMPESLQRLAQAREMYIARVSDADDSEDVREAYDFNNAVLLYNYGYWEHARERFERIFDERCSGPYADETGEFAWNSLRNMAIALQMDGEIERLATELQNRRCTFTPDSTGPQDFDCSLPENRERPQCLVLGDLNSIRYRRALEIYRQAEGASGTEQRTLYERSATMLIEAVNRNPGDPQAPIALEYAATALERTSRFESAARLYQRIIEEVSPRRGADDEENRQLDAILANAYFRLAFNANRFFDFDRAVENYRTLADLERFQRSSDPTIREKREDALINAAIILENLRRYSQATEYYRRAAALLEDRDARVRAFYRIAEMQYSQENWNGTVTEMTAFLNNPVSSGAGELRVQARWRIAEARERLRRRADYLSSLGDVVNEFSRSGEATGSIAAEYAAHAKFLLVDEGMDEFEGVRIDPGRPRNMEAYVNAITSQIDDASNRAKARAEAYDSVPGYRRPTWTIAALVRQGRVYEVLVRAILDTPFIMPADLQAQLRRVTPDQREEIRIQVEDTVRATLDTRVRPIECLAVARYALASRAGRRATLDNEYTQLAADRLQAYGDERIAECIAEAQRNDPQFGAYTPGEFARAPRGQNLDMQAGIGPPALSSE